MVELVVATTPFQIVVINTKLRQHKMQQHYRLTIETHALNFVKFVLSNIPALGVMMRMVHKPSSGSI
jgi:hypothetical protein